jgi:hypothetical protein
MSLDQDREQLDQLVSNPKDSYGESFQAHLLEQYKLYVESSQKVTDRRITTGNYLLTVNSFLLTVFGVASSQHLGGVWLAIVPVAGLLVSFTWYSLVVFYRNLGAGKYKVVHQLESFLPVAPFRCEWRSAHDETGRRHTGVTHLERVIPLAFAAIYVVLLGFSLSRSFGK